jgi:hypothetical protein
MNPAPRPRSPFVTFLYFALGLGAVLLLVGGVGLYLFLRTDQGKKILTVAREGSALLAQAALAPGTGELRSIGCETALSVPAGKIVELFRQLDPEGKAGEVGAGFLAVGGLDAETPVIFCAQRAGQAGIPDCASAAKVYASVQLPPPARFVVLMAPRRGDLAGCSGIYAPDGTRVADLPKPPEKEPAPSPPQERPTATPSGPSADRGPHESLQRPLS